MEEYVNYAQKTIDESPQMDEANTKAAILQPAFLDLLGWEIPDNTQLEYSVEAFGKTYRVDYALILEGAPVAFIEAKGVDTSLIDKHRKQLKAYLKNEDVNLGILTNGEKYEFYRRRVIDSKVNVNTLAEISLQNLPDRVTILEAYTKDAIQTDEWEKILNRLRELEAARETLKSEKDNLAADIREVLSESVSGVISSQAESQAKEMIDRLVQDIETEIDSSGGSGKERQQTSSGRISHDDVSGASGEYIVEIFNGETALSRFADDNQSDLMAEVVNYLIENHDLISELEPIPYVPGQKNALINDQPTHPDGEREMRTYRELTEGYCLFTSFNKGDKKRHLESFAEKCGLDLQFEGSW